MKKKVIVAATIPVLVGVVILMKINNERNVQQLGKSFSEIYDDRLVVESYIYRLTDLFYKKELALVQYRNLHESAINSEVLQKQTAEIAELSEKYATTQLTESEQRIFKQLRNNVQQLKIAESHVPLDEKANRLELERICKLALNRLELLSSIQVEEGNLLKESGTKMLASNRLSVQLEWAAFFVIAILLLSMLRKKKIFEIVLQSHQLN